MLEKNAAKETEAEAEGLADAKKEVRPLPTSVSPCVLHVLNYLRVSTVTIKRIQRNKNKYETSTHGLEAPSV